MSGASSKHDLGPMVFRRGEVIYKAGDPVRFVYLVQAGLVSLRLPHGGVHVEYAQVGASQLLGAEVFWGVTRWSTTAVANNNVEAIAIPVAEAMAVLRSGSSLVKLFSKGVIEKLRASSDNLISIKIDADHSPCGPERIVKLFGSLHTAAKYTGKTKDGATTVVWAAYKKYCQRTFLESPVRLEHAIKILVKLGHARIQYAEIEDEKSDEPEDIEFIHFKDLERIKGFFEFYRAHFYGANRHLPPVGEYAYLVLLHEIEQWNATGTVLMNEEPDHVAA
ncbi:cyclic nucleotide-binding domain-containing protein [Bdellovibrionota bacterium FG-1]